MALDNIQSKALLFNNFSPATDEEVEEISREATQNTTRGIPIGVVPYVGVENAPNRLGGVYPQGSNEQLLVINYAERARYKNAAYFSRDGLPRPLESLYDKNFYGRVDRFQNVIVPKRQSSLYDQVPSNPRTNVVAFDFVARAVSQLRRNVKIAGDLGGVVQAGNYYDIEGAKGWYDYCPAYAQHINHIFDAYARWLQTIPKQRFNQILTLKHFIDEFLQFMKSSGFPTVRAFTLTAFVTSTKVSPRISGICVETTNRPFGNDLKTYNEYLLDPNFSYFVRAAGKYGLYVDRNAPWRLYANLLSRPIRDFIHNHHQQQSGKGIGFGNMFDIYYDQTYMLDVPLLQEKFVDAFNNFRSANPRVVESIPGTVRCPVPSFSVTAFRFATTIEAARDLGYAYWLGIYFDLRSRETNVKYKNRDMLVQRALEVQRALGLAAGSEYGRHGANVINNLFKPYLYESLLFRRGLTAEQKVVRIGTVEDYQIWFDETGDDTLFLSEEAPPPL
jgi:hypothetical protein